MDVVNLCSWALSVRLFKFGDGFGRELVVPPDRQASVQGPRRPIMLLQGSLYYEFPGLFMIQEEPEDLEGGFLALPLRGQLWYRLPGADAVLHVWRYGEAPEEAPPPKHGW